MPTFKLKWINTHTHLDTNTHPKSHLQILIHRSIMCSILYGIAVCVCNSHMVYRAYIETLDYSKKLKNETPTKLEIHSEILKYIIEFYNNT